MKVKIDAEGEGVSVELGVGGKVLVFVYVGGRRQGRHRKNLGTDAFLIFLSFLPDIFLFQSPRPCMPPALHLFSGRLTELYWIWIPAQ